MNVSFFQLHQKTLTKFCPKKLQQAASDSVDVSGIRESIKEINERYHNLRDSCDKLGVSLASVSEKERIFTNALEKMNTWFVPAEQTLGRLKYEPVGTEPSQVTEQLDRVKNFSAEAITQGKVLDELRKAEKSYVESLKDLGTNESSIRDLEEKVNQTSDRLGFITADATAKSNVLQTALVQSQGVQAGIDSLLKWIKDTEATMNNLRPVSLSRENLREQVQELQVLKADVKGHRPGVESVHKDGAELIKTSDKQLANAISDRLDDLNTRYQAIYDKCQQRENNLKNVSDKLSNFHEAVQKHNDWIIPAIDVLESRETNMMDTPLFRGKIEEVAKDKDQKLNDLENIKDLGQALVKDANTAEPAAVKECLANLERNWHDFNEVLSDKQKEATFREQQSNRYALCREEVLQWLARTEERVDSLDAAAIDVEVIEQQIEDLQVNVNLFDLIYLRIAYV